ncbi:MAG: hypothetical protein KBG20_04145 [Caldilineaceae bacterium]|nr:hypothetical protein [Caldilineaceae bacterium]MBP8106855.1 hypothetical protein [Caldilineaceae bacterium]MBP8121749.1 hypothetical protein [Caldilineaceae bacterium]MBP9071461.1 hypothetical protein [Caldilineaceae bacterium]
MANDNESTVEFEGINQVFGTDEVPAVTPSTLKIYLEYLQKHLSLPCTLTGIESIGYFGWEERFEFGHGSKREYEKLRKKRGSLNDSYELSSLDNARLDRDSGIVVVVNRLHERKRFEFPQRNRFEIPLAELEAEDKASDNYQLLDDYSVWFANWR